ANVSNLLLARSAYRVRETTVRSALGASRGRLVLHMLAEGFVISAIVTVIAGRPAPIRASRPSLDALLRDGGRTGTGLAIGRIAWGLVVVEVALACVLLGISALMTKSVLNATLSDLGVRTDDIMTARVGLTAGT